jgi:uncharacterized protein involved in exopolysaccharide biosynthesis
MDRPKKIAGFTLLVAGLVLCGTGLWLLLSPAQYRATVRIELNPESRDVSDIGQPVSYDPYFIQTEFEVIQSQLVLGKVIAALNLNVVWGKKYGGSRTLTTNECIAALKKHLRITPVRNTKLIEISFASNDPDEAARIANSIAEAYQNYRLEKQKQETLKGIQTLTEEFQTEKQTIKTRQRDLDQLRKQLNVPSPEPADELLKSSYPAYFQAKHELQNAIDFHKLVGAKIESKKLDLSVPKTSLTAILDAAQPPKSPVWPNRWLGAALFALGSLSIVSGLSLLKSSSRQRLVNEITP